MDAAVPVAVGHENFAFGAKGDFGGQVEGAGGLLDYTFFFVVSGVGRLVRIANGQQQYAFGGVMLDHVCVPIRQPVAVVGGDCDSVGVGEGASTP